MNDGMMSGLKIFFGAHAYLTGCVRASLAALDRDRLKNVFSILINSRNNNFIVDGQGRSLQSILLFEDCLEHNGFPIILPAHSSNLRPWTRNDVFIFNTGSGSGSPMKHAEDAKNDGLKVLGMSYNKALADKYPDVLILEPSKSNNPLYAPLGTEFELTSAVIGASIGYSVRKNVEDSIIAFEESSKKIVDAFESTYSYLEDNLESLMNFINLVSDYIPITNRKHIYFMGVGRDAIVNQVTAIRYGHLCKEPDKDLKVIYDGHWDLRQPGDLVILTSGSGSTSQILDYSLQGFISGLRIYAITSFEDSDLGRFAKRCDGCLVIPGRRNRFSMYNLSPNQRENYLPEFELNTYITLDSLLAQIAINHGITENDMRQHHKLKKLE